MSNTTITTGSTKSTSTATTIESNRTCCKNPIVSDHSSDGDGNVIFSTTPTITTKKKMKNQNRCRTNKDTAAPVAPMTVPRGEDISSTDHNSLMKAKKTKKKDNPMNDASVLGEDTVSNEEPVSYISKPKSPVISVTEEAIRNIQKERQKQQLTLQEKKASSSKTTADTKLQRHDGKIYPYFTRPPTITPWIEPRNDSFLQLFPSHLCAEYVQLQQQYEANQLQHSNSEYHNMLQMYQQQQLYHQPQYGPPNALLNQTIGNNSTLYHGDTYYQRILAMSAPNLLLVPKPKEIRPKRRCSSKSLPSITAKKVRTTADTMIEDATQKLRSLSKHDVATAVQCLHIPPTTTSTTKHHPLIQLIPPQLPLLTKATKTTSTTKKCDKLVQIVPKPPPPSPPIVSSILPPTPRHQKGVRFTNMPILSKTVLSPQLKRAPPSTSMWTSLPTCTTTTSTTASSPTLSPPSHIKESTASLSLMDQPTPAHISESKPDPNHPTCHPTKAVPAAMRHIAVVSPPNCGGGGSYYHDHPMDNDEDSIQKQHGSESGTYPSIHIPDESITTTTNSIQSNATSAFISYTASNDTNYDDENDWNIDSLYTDLLCMEEILSLSDSHHSYQSCMTYQTITDAPDDIGYDASVNEGTII